MPKTFKQKSLLFRGVTLNLYTTTTNKNVGEKTMNKKNICDKCGHIWKYTGSLNFATCPSCTLKTKVKVIEEEE